VRVIQELARHRDLATTQRYIGVSVDKLRNAVNLVGICDLVAQPVAH
jgi:site-specific recombinase XerD